MMEKVGRRSKIRKEKKYEVHREMVAKPYRKKEGENRKRKQRKKRKRRKGERARVVIIMT